MNSNEFQGRVVIVTGAASGIGAATSTRLAELGACVVVCDFDKAAVLAFSSRLNANGGNTVGIAADVRDAAALQLAVDLAVSEFGGLHLAVNNAGVATPFAPVGSVAIEEWDRQIAINLTGAFNSLKAEIPAMISSGGGSIVNVASIAGVNGIKGRGAYVAAKHGLIGLTKSAALDYADQGLRVNAVAPGYVDSPLLRDRSESERRLIEEMHPLGRMSTVDEQAELIIFLLSSRSSFCTGACYLADGGFSAR
ncbi:SDR family NAD(P)-dependent oxidoreductase [Variovorax sp. J22R133]|uniref:SDR family NAD(P)-dependent oxidoreductase n=1 Tax=Variovorax brevis TaxID=3053503 RepID=UPI00257707D8|nr:SDR family NAD(P)-dependent oxidoreductase [Variovorax sp. J22R133]MDM0116113.1 SDR family NAD(P)-dependent oxidoreductase [Variovorax sp. J22R133]